MEAPKTRTLLVSAAIALLALSFAPIPALAASGSNSCSLLSVTASGLVVNPSNPAAAVPYTLSLSGTTLLQKGALAQGTISGTFNADQVTGVFSYNTASDKLLAKLTGPGYELDLAFVTSGAVAGFTFIGTTHVVGQQPQMLQTDTLHGFTCS